MSSASNAWHALSTRRIYFGHQSVGQHLIDGIAALCRTTGTPLPLVEGDAPHHFAGPVFAHSRIGVNRDPDSKIGAFAAKLRAGIGSRAEIAFFKLCYVDVTAATDVPQLFRHYAATMAQLKSEYRDTVLAHVTVPLTAGPPRWRYWAGRLLNRPVHSVADNIARTHFNDLLRRAYGGREPLFDLALLEAGTRPTLQRDPGGDYLALDRRLTSDGGHLNTQASLDIGAAMLDFLSALPITAATADTSTHARRAI